jgi:hypothetical protein
LKSGRALLVGGLLLLLLSTSAQGADGAGGGDGDGDALGKRPKLPKPLGTPPASSASSTSSTGTGRGLAPGSGTGDGVIEVTSPTYYDPSADQLAAMRARASERGDVGTVKASPELEPRHGQTPIGFDPDKARAQAPGIAALLATKGPKGYPRKRLSDWQTLAGLRPDGTYGGSTRGALVFYGVAKPPRPFVTPFATLPYHPPGMAP